MPTIDLGKVVGPKGDKGDTGPQGVQGIQGIQGQTGPGVAPGGAENSLLAKNSTVDYDTKWMTMAQVGTELVKPDNPVGVALSGKASNPNLLDNWYFVGGGSQQGGGQFPINQRGETEYTGLVYGIDRWKLNSSNNKLILKNDSVSLVSLGAGGFPSIRQYIENYKTYIGKMVTLSALYRNPSGAAFNISIKGIEGAGFSYIINSDVTDEWSLLTCSGIVPTNSTMLSANLIINNPTADEMSIDIMADKLELGPVQTLAHKEGDTWVLNDPPPNFQQELAKCQRYQLTLVGPNENWKTVAHGLAVDDTHANILIPTPVTLRANPDVEFGGTDWYLESPNAHILVTNVTKNVATSSAVEVIVTVAGGLTANNVYSLVKWESVSSDTKLILNCNL